MDLTTKEKIMEVAEQLFAEKGYDATSVREIVKAADINISMISYYFSSKRGLFEELVKSKAVIREEMVIQISQNNDDIREKLKLVIGYYVDAFFKNRYLCAIMTRELSQKSKEGDNLLSILFNDLALFRSVLNTGIEEGRIREIDVDLAITSFISTILHVINTPSIYLESFNLKDPEEMFQEPNESKVKIRLKNYLYELAKSYILKEN
jgi:AcrR family transcriptional regulator